MCKNKTDGCFFSNGEKCLDIPCYEREIALQCSDCYYWHDDAKDEYGNLWVSFCDLFHGNGIAIPCDQHMTEEEHKSLIEALKRAKYEKSVPFKDVLDKIAVAGNEKILQRGTLVEKVNNNG